MQLTLSTEEPKKPENTCGKCIYLQTHMFTSRLKYCGLSSKKIRSRYRACSMFIPKNK